jgi:hypothetical protein
MNLLRPISEFNYEKGFSDRIYQPVFNFLISFLSWPVTFIRQRFTRSFINSKRLKSRSVKVGRRVREVVMKQHITLHVDDPISSAIEALLDNHANYFTVCDGRYIVGKVGRKEIVEAMANHKTHGTIGEIMNETYNQGNTINYPPHFLSMPHQDLITHIDIQYIVDSIKSTSHLRPRVKKHVLR